MLLVKNLKFLHYSFLDQIGLEIVVGDVLHRNYRFYMVTKLCYS